MKTNNRRPQYKIRPNVKVKNRFTNDVLVGDIINEEEIEGKPFFIMKVGPRTLKLAKDGYSITK